MSEVTYTQIALMVTSLAVIADLFVFRTQLVRRRIFWVAYSIIIFFQFVTNGILTGFGMVKYRAAAIIGGDSPALGVPTLIGDGRLFFAPVEDVFFGFSLVLLTLTLWVWFGRQGLQRRPLAGPPDVRVRKFLRDQRDL